MTNSEQNTPRLVAFLEPGSIASDAQERREGLPFAGLLRERMIGIMTNAAVCRVCRLVV